MRVDDVADAAHGGSALERSATLAVPDDTSAPRATAAKGVGAVALWAVAALVAAAVGEGLGGAPTPVLGGAAAIGALGAVAATARARAMSSVARGVVGVVLVVATVAAAAGARMHVHTEGLLVDLARDGGERRIAAVVVREPHHTAAGWHVVVRVEQVEDRATRERAVTVVADPPVLGERWEALVTARPLPEGGYGRWLARQHTAVMLDVVDRETVAGPGRLARASEHVRERVRQASTARQAGRVGGLLTGFVTGDTRLLPSSDVEAMRRTGLTHLTAVSGSNVAIVAAGVYALAVAVRVGLNARIAMIATTIVWFAFVTRMQPSVLRAGVMALVVLFVAARGVRRDSRHALATAVLLLVLVDPLLAGSLGLRLSALATLGILVASPLIQRRFEQLPRRLAKVTSITLAAQVAVLPLLLASFGEVAVSSVPANVVAVPAAMVAAVLSFVGAVVAVVEPGLAGWVFWLAGWPARVVLASAHGFADVGGLAALDRPASVIAALLGAGWFLGRPGSRVSRTLAVGAAIAVVAACIPSVVGAVAPRELTVTAIDVGQGDAFLLESPHTRVLVDAGGDDTAARWLRRNGRRHLDLLIVTHPHLDHVGGVADVLRRVRVDAIWYRPQPNSLVEVDDMLAEAAARDIPVRSPSAHDVAVVGDVALEVLHPPHGRPYRHERSELNDASTVVRVTGPEGRRVLFTGDVERAGQRDLLAAVPDRLRAEMITVPHHGGDTSEFEFLAATAASEALIGTGLDNRHGHPHPRVLAMLDELDMRVHRTDLDGTVGVTVPPRRTMPSAPGPGGAQPIATSRRGGTNRRAPVSGAAAACVRRSGRESAPRTPCLRSGRGLRPLEVAGPVRSRCGSGPGGRHR